jgi:membrane fusion protein (multidrug efflux system)
MLKRFFLTLLVLVLVVGGLAGLKYMQIRKMVDAGKNRIMPPALVTTAPVLEKTWQESLHAVGSLSAVQGVMVSAELSGKVVKISFTSGNVVRKGDILVRLDTLSEQARLASARSAVTLAKINLERTRDLVTKKSLSRSSLDKAEADYKQAVAVVEEIRAAIDKKIIRAPFSGRLGIRQVNLGQIVAPGDPIVQLQSLDPIYVNFFLPQQEIAEIKPGLKVEISSDVFPGTVMQGTITALDPGVDPANRNIHVQATLANDDEKLRPGMFVRVNVLLPEQKQVLIIPSTSVLYAPYGDAVFVVDETRNEKTGKQGHVLRKQVVRVGRARGDYVVVTRGLKKGETVVTTGVFKFRNGQPVVIDNALSPEFKLAPELENR